MEFKTDYRVEDYVLNTCWEDLPWITEKFRRITAPFLSAEGQQYLLSLLTEDLDKPLSDAVAGVNRALKDFPSAV